MRSMTGFGKGSVSLTACQQSYDIEILSVNRRQLELRLNMPPEFNAFDQEIRALVAEFISRGVLHWILTSCGNLPDAVLNYAGN